METLFARHYKYISETPMRIIRSMMQRINWDSRLISIKGPKGVGKSTLMRQYIKLNYKDGFPRSAVLLDGFDVLFDPFTA